MEKSLKLVTTLLMVIILVVTCAGNVFADGDAVENGTDLIGQIEDKISITEADPGNLVTLAGKIIGLIQLASAVAAVVLVAVFGFKFIMGSANEKADYQKSFIPLIVGVVVVFSATTIAKLLFSLLENTPA